MSYLVTDIEAVTDKSLWTPPEKKEGEKEVFPPVFSWKIISIGCVRLERDFSIDSNKGPIVFDMFEGVTSERYALLKFSDYMSGKSPTLVTWNGNSFDVPVLSLRAMRMGIQQSWVMGKDFRYRYAEGGHLDLKDHMSNFGAAQGFGLDGIARVIGLPGKVGVDGSMVAHMYKNAEDEKISHYCMSDSLQTAFIHMRWSQFVGRMKTEEYREKAGRLLEAVEADGRFKELVAGIDRKVLLISSTP